MARHRRNTRRATQARAKATVETILSGAAQVLARVGYGGATTDRIAERAPRLTAKLLEFTDQLVALTMRLIGNARPELNETELRTLAKLLVATSEGMGRPLRQGPNPALLNAFVEMIDSYILSTASGIDRDSPPNTS